MLPPRAYVFIGLNALRILSIIALLLVFSSSIVVMVHDIEAVNRYVAESSNGTEPIEYGDYDYIPNSTVPNQPAGAFWAVLNRLLIIGQVVVLILSELGWPSSFFIRFFPVLGRDFGVGALGVIQCLIGASVLSHFIDGFALVSAFFLFSIGCLNILGGLIFRESSRAKRSITSWRERSKNVFASPIGALGRPIATISSMFDSKEKSSNRCPTSPPSFTAKVGHGFGSIAGKAAASQGFVINRPVESFPRH
ncbi:hypothetical protein SERLA73DRAFT_188017 [Serpula lacrymans var. lacrymans S7.3]|uniref:DUF7598 domain-containing protein n=2 Tax=Serpula lacrymans var. lacrymans TaxID=341189 RepID=F8QA10_SERL3|nr:uncharacterized protein SERLADRAFT_477966 [Serpula lacrymans var. lacrymans S7.9]EGN94915.1 hypothetical protein SERLA73DRAFT_188017 [Serpula lacrymans var. lacrymans S7.3]EGO20413.1 hypothetical protein SERLADRAFT_477966 [Serpula lacrymans var. lacrymans S7.9]